MSDLVVDVLGLNKRYRTGRAEKIAVEGFDLQLSRAGSVAVVGESGSGKSTVARCLVGLETPTEGSITICGRERHPGRPGSSERRLRAREIQMVFQDPYASLNPSETVSRGLRRALAARDGRSARSVGIAEVVELLATVELAPRVAGMRPRQLSGGQRQRVAIARALAAGPEVLVLDEAVAALDLSVQAQVLNVLAEVRRNVGISYLFISHDLAVVRQISDELIVMREGRVIERGPTGAVLDDPAEPYTRELLDAVPRPGWVPRPARVVLTTTRPVRTVV